MLRVLALLYGVLGYVASIATISYLIVFLGFFIVPAQYRAAVYVPLRWSCDNIVHREADFALWIDLGLLLLFGVQHSVMARPGFKAVWTRLVPRPIERSTYVLFSSACMWALFLLWEPIPERIWPSTHSEITELAPPLFAAVYSFGWGLVLGSSFMIDHFALFGLKQPLAYFRGRELPAPEFKTPGLYRWVRHPLMLGFLLAFWATPVMTLGRLIFAGGMTLYIFVGMRLEERDMHDVFGEPYRAWRSGTSMIFPLRRPR